MNSWTTRLALGGMVHARHSAARLAGGAGAGRRGVGGEQAFCRQQAGQGNAAQPAAGLPEKIAPRGGLGGLSPGGRAMVPGFVIGHVHCSTRNDRDSHGLVC